MTRVVSRPENQLGGEDLRTRWNLSWPSPEKLVEPHQDFGGLNAWSGRVHIVRSREIGTRSVAEIRNVRPQKRVDTGVVPVFPLAEMRLQHWHVSRKNTGDPGHQRSAAGRLCAVHIGHGPEQIVQR